MRHCDQPSSRMPIEDCQAFSMTRRNHPRRATSIIVPVRAAAALSQPLLGVKLRSSAAFHRSFDILAPKPAKQSNSNNTQGKASSLVVVLLLLKLLQYRTESHWL
ncbi:hypothetical protein BDR03DRAFT_295651 [Suillus americanus]|nr:hypothetical protein BDR03DRAFT_295651 [Suillus americanus]